MQVAAALSGLLKSRQGPSNTQQARALVEALRQHGGNPAIATPALLLLSRWAPLQSSVPQVEGEHQVKHKHREHLLPLQLLTSPS